VAGLARAIEHQQRALLVVIADLHRAFTLARHVAVGARHTGPRVHTMRVQLELRVLRVQHLGA
jgi:hypothetical protein